MSEQNTSSDTSSQVPGIAVVAMILGFLVYKDTAFESSRPSMTEAEKTSTEDVRARLWQDPFEAVQLHIKQTGYSGEPGEIIELDKKHSIQMGKAPQRICNSGNPNNHAHSIEELRCQIQRDTQENEELRVVAVMIPGGPYAEDREWRLRYRYAVISQLTDMNYIPENPEHIGFIDFLYECKSNTDKKFCDWPNYMPYEWFKSRLSAKVLVLWLDNDAFSLNKDPLNMLGRLKNGITPGEKAKDNKFGKNDYVQPSLNIIGPHSSDTMEQMLREIEEAVEECGKDNSPEDSCANYNYLNESLLFSPTATIDEEELNFKFQDSGGKFYEWFHQKLIRTTPTNEHLVNQIFEELKLRRINIKKPEEDALQEPQENTPQNHIVLISESDTIFSRSLIQRILVEHDKNKAKIIRFGYLRGIDGINSAESQAFRNDNKQEQKSLRLQKSKTDKEQRRPEGSNQFDYLRRLATHMQALQEATEGRIKAIGILGNDPYDKLLILQALHKKFPRTVFFTTDLDSRFIHPAELPWTRNLIVASPYGLNLHPGLQKHTPPFRDSYQTAIYLTTKLAIECRGPNKNDIECFETDEIDTKEIIKLFQDEKSLSSLTRLFEIGNEGPVDFSQKNESDIKIHPDPRALSDEIIEIHKQVLFILLVITAFLLFLAPSYVRGYIQYILLSLSILTIVFLYLVNFTNYPADKNFSFTWGTDTWPANAIRLFAITMSGAFFYHIVIRITKSNKRIQDDFFFTSNICLKGTIFQPRFLIDKWGKKNNTVEAAIIWGSYLQMKKKSNCLLRVSFLIFLFLICFSFIIANDLDSVFDVPSRGEESYYLNLFVFIVSIIAYWVLVFSITDMSHLSSRFIYLLINNEIIWPGSKLNQYCSQYDLPEDIAKQKLAMDLVNRLASAINSFIYYPFIVLFLLILSRSHYFDNWHYTPQLLTVISLTAAIAVLSAIRIRNAAIKAREHILERLESPYRNSITHKEKEHAHSIQLLVEEIRDLKTGPFLPLSQHPIVLSILLPIGSIAGLYMIEHFTALN